MDITINGGGVEEDEEKKKREAGAGGGAPQGPAPTFAMLQRQGYPRPAPQANQGLASTFNGQPMQALASMMGGGPSGPPSGEQRDTGQEAERSRAAYSGGDATYYAQDRRNAGSMQRIPAQQPGGASTQPPPGAGMVPFDGIRPVTSPNSPDPNPGTTNGRPQTPFGANLMGQYMNYQGPGQFNGQAQMVNAPQYQAGAGPMAMPQGGPNVPNAYQPGQFQGRYDALSAPGLRQTGQFQGGGSAFGGQLEQALMGQLQNPSSFNQDAVQQMFNRLSGQIDDEYTQKDRLLGEDMARRGLSESSIRGGRMADLNVQKRSAKTELGDRLLERMAQTGSADRQAAISQAMGYDANQFGQGLQGYQANLGANQQNFQQDLMARAFQGDQNAMQIVQNMGIQGFNNQAGQQGFQNQMNTAQMQNQFGNDLFQRQLGASQFNQGLGQAQFNNQLAGAQFNAGQNQQQYQNNLTNFQANLGAGQQGFNQRQALLSGLLGYEQQGFDNEFQNRQFEADNDFRNRQLAAAMASLGL
jgi:hypothetical protein